MRGFDIPIESTLIEALDVRNDDPLESLGSLANHDPLLHCVLLDVSLGSGPDRLDGEICEGGRQKISVGVEVLL